MSIESTQRVVIQSLSPEQQRQQDDVRAQAWAVVRRAADLLRQGFGVTKIMASGSLAYGGFLTLDSTLELVAWDIPADRYFRAVGELQLLSPDFAINLLDGDRVRPHWWEVIRKEVVDV